MCILSLPNELIEYIMCFCDLESLYSMSQSCQRLHSLHRSQIVWKAIFFNRYPRLRGACEEQHLICADQTHPDKSRDGRSVSWRAVFRRRWCLTGQLCRLLDSMGDRYWSIGGLPDPARTDLQPVITEYGLPMVQDALLEVLGNGHSRPLLRSEHLSRRYYARMLFRELERDYVLLGQFRQLLHNSDSLANVPEAFHLLDRWLQPERVSPNPYNLDDAEELVVRLALAELRSTSPDHPAVHGARSSHDHRAPTLWTDPQVETVLDVVNAAFLPYAKLVVEQQCPNVPDNGMEEVEGLVSAVCPEVLVSVRYCRIVCRLGVCAQLTCFPGFSVVRCLNREGGELTFVNVTRGGFRQTREEIMENPALRIRNVRGFWFQPVLLAKLLQGVIGKWSLARRATRMLDSDVLALSALYSWLDNDCIVDCGSVYALGHIYAESRPAYMLHQIQLLRDSGVPLSAEESRALQIMQVQMENLREHIMKRLDIQQQAVSGGYPSPVQDVQARWRLGDIVRHRKYGYKATVTGWTAICEASVAWMEQMGVDWLPNGRRQPFFNVLAADGSNRYAALDNLLLPETPCEIRHREIGRYFVRLTGDRYVPVPSLLARFPDPPGRGDTAADGASEAAADSIDGATSSSPPTPASQSCNRSTSEGAVDK